MVSSSFWRWISSWMLGAIASSPMAMTVMIPITAKRVIPRSERSLSITVIINVFFLLLHFALLLGRDLLRYRAWNTRNTLRSLLRYKTGRISGNARLIRVGSSSGRRAALQYSLRYRHVMPETEGYILKNNFSRCNIH